MADIDQIIAGGAGASSRADFSGLPKILDSYYKGRDEFAKNDLRDAFKGGVPLTADGQPDFGAMAKTLFQKGGLNEGTAAANLGLQQQNQQFGQGQSSRIQSFEGGAQPPQQPIVSPPSSNRSASAVVAPPLNRGGEVPQGQGSPRGDQPGSIVGMVSAAGVPDELAGPIIQQVSAATRSDPNAAVNPQLAPRVQQIVAEAVRRSAAGNQPGSTAPIVPTPVATQPQPPQGQPAPVTNAVTTTAGPQTPSRTDQAIAFYSGIMSDQRSPKQNVELAKTRLEALQKSNELTPDQKNYAQYKLEGGQGTMQDFLTDTEAGKAGATERAKANVKEQQEYIDSGKAASQRLTTLNAISNVVNNDKNTGMGYAGDTELKVKMALQRLGFDFGDLSGAELMQKMNASLASEMAKSLTARSTQFEFKTFLGNNPGLLLDKTGNQRLIGIFSQLAKRDVDLGKLARQNQDNWQNWDNVVEKYDAQKEHQIIDPISKRPISTNSIVAPGPAKSTMPALEPGKTMMNGYVFKGGDPKNRANWEQRS